MGGVKSFYRRLHVLRHHDVGAAAQRLTLPRQTPDVARCRCRGTAPVDIKDEIKEEIMGLLKRPPPFRRPGGRA